MAHPGDLSSLTVWIDADCALCSRLGRWIQQRAQSRGLWLRLLPLPAGSEALVVEDGHHRWEAAEALCVMLSQLGGSLRIAAWLLQRLPTGLRQGCYRWVAQHRYALFGRATCPLNYDKP